MAGTAVFAPKYAHAFASVAASAHLDVKLAEQQMQDFAGSLDGSPELREILMDPSVAAEQKLAIVDAMAERIGMYREVRNFIAIIMDHGRLMELGEILSEYHMVADADAGLAEAEVTSARELHGEDRTDLEWQISKMVVSRVTVSYKVDPALIGGAVVRVGSTVYDGSVRAQLEQMKQALTAR